MNELLDGVVVEKNEKFSVCHVVDLSDDLKELIRNKLSVICHGTHILEYGEHPLYSYKNTIRSFLDRYDRKADSTQKGIVGELLTHVLLTEVYDDFDVVTAFFNLEEKSIKKGFDLILFKPDEDTVWITEVKSGELHKDKTVDQTTLDFLKLAKADLDKRLNESESMFWYNALNSVRAALIEEKDYKKTIIRILLDEGNAAAGEEAQSDDNNVVLVSNLFEPLESVITAAPALAYLEQLDKAKVFENVIILCLQKGTYSKVVDFLRAEVAHG